MSGPPATFGRRGAARQPDSNIEAASPTTDSLPPKQVIPPQRMVLMMFIMIPTTVFLVVLAAHLIKSSSSPSGISSESVNASNGRECRSKAAEGSIFDIDWCEAGAAAVQGAAQGVAVGAGRAK